MLIIICSFGYESVYLPLLKVADTPFHIQGDELCPKTCQAKIHPIMLQIALPSVYTDYVLKHVMPKFTR